MTVHALLHKSAGNTVYTRTQTIRKSDNEKRTKRFVLDMLSLLTPHFAVLPKVGSLNNESIQYVVGEYAPNSAYSTPPWLPQPSSAHPYSKSGTAAHGDDNGASQRSRREFPLRTNRLSSTSYDSVHDVHLPCRRRTITHGELRDQLTDITLSTVDYVERANNTKNIEIWSDHTWTNHMTSS